jgi:lysine-N-methylase
MKDDAVYSTLNYMARFGCIGADCEDNCCHSWNVFVDKDTHNLLKLALKSNPEHRKKLKTHFTKVKIDKKRTQTMIRLNKDGTCPMLEPSGLCWIHSNYNERLLPDVCATYPRRVSQIGNRQELTGAASCPEVTRQLLLYDDAMTPTHFDPESQSRQILSSRQDPRDVRPYWHMQLTVRGFLIDLLNDGTRTMENRLFTVCYFAHRTQDTMNKQSNRCAVEAINKEIENFKESDFLDAIEQRSEAVSPPSSMVVLLVREMLKGEPSGRARISFKLLTRLVFDTYRNLEQLSDNGELKSLGAEKLTQEIFNEYQARKNRIKSVATHQIERYFINLAIYYLMHHQYFSAPELLTYFSRHLTQMAVVKFLLFSHPSLLDVSDDDIGSELDKAVVEVVYKTARYIEHSDLLHKLEETLQKHHLSGLAGALYLIRF